MAHSFIGHRILGAECGFKHDGEVCGAVAGSKLHAGFAPTYLPVPTPTKRAYDELFVDRVGPVQHWPGSAEAVWSAHSQVVADLIKGKSAGYGNAWVEQGYMGNLARVLSKTSRLKNMMWRDADDTSAKDYGTQQESVLDTLMDLSALCAFAIANLEDGNRWGR